MRHFLIALLAALPSMVSPSLANPLAGFEWEKRPLLLFSKSRSSALLDRQIDLLRQWREELAERDMIVLVTEGRQNTVAAIGYARLPQTTARALKQRFEPVGSGLTIVLVGKDGTEKGRWTKVTNPQVFFDLVDSMPMRQKEMKEQSAVN